MAFLCATTVHAQFKDPQISRLNQSETASEMQEQIQFLSSAALEGRGAGTEGEKAAAAFLSRTFESYGVDVLSGADGDVFGISRESGDTLVSRNVIGFIQGYDKSLRDRYIVIGARLDNIGTRPVVIDGETREKIYYGANGNASGLAMLLQLARMLSTNSVLLKRSVLLVGFGSSLCDGAGSWYFLNRSFADAANIDAMVNLDMVGTGSNGFYAYTASNTDLNRILAEMGETLQPVQPQVVAKEPVSSDHRSFYNKEIPAVMFTTGMYPEYNSERDTESVIEYDEMERELEYLYNFSVKLVNGPKPEFTESAQKTAKRLTGRDVVPYYECDYKPTFLGSSDPTVFLQKWVYVYLKYPQECVREGVQGRVLVDFVIDAKGKVKDVRVLKGVDERLDAAAVKVIEASPDWKPGRVRGVKVDSEMSLYVEFRLKKRK